MELQQTIQELNKNIEELQRQYWLKRLRRILKLVVIGFFIGRNSEKRIRELERRNKSLIQRVTSYIQSFENQEHGFHQRIKSITDTYAKLKGVKAKAKSLEENFPHIKPSILEVKERLETQIRLLIENLKGAIERQLAELETQVEEIETSNTYLISADKQQYVASVESFEEDLDYCVKQHILDKNFTSKQKALTKQYLKRVLDYNQHFITRRKKEYSNLWHIDPISLDDEQQTAIVTDDKHNLVIAAAGSGKTEVLTTRIAYLISRKPDTIRPKRILAIAYQRKAMEQIEQRLHRRYNIQEVSIKTFHKLGKDILEEAGDYYVHTDIVDDNKKHEMISRTFKRKVKNEPSYYQLFLDFIRALQDKEISKGEQEKEETLAYARERPYFSINNIEVHSRAEKDILDFFLMHKLNGRAIAIRYEPDIGGFRPDFHLPEYDLFIEHWGLTQEGVVPKWFSQTTEEYKQAMEMKKQWLADHDKVLIETFAYEYNEDNTDDFFRVIKSRVTHALQKKYGEDFKFTLKSYEEVLDIAWQSYNTPAEDIKNFITIAKTYGLRPTDITEKLHKGKWSPKQRAFSNLVLPIFVAYEDALRKAQKIDFEDMINKAIAKLKDDPNLRANLYDHILIDEYQDISAQRYKLIRELMERNSKCKLFCVGDDWQSIMGFSGSNLNLFVNFKQYFANPAITKISTNYRSNKTIVSAGKTLIQHNTSCQIQKPTQSHNHQIRPIRILKAEATEYEFDNNVLTAEDCVNRIQHHLSNGCSPTDILVLSRCMRTRTKPSGYKFLSYVKLLIDRAKENEMPLAYDRVHSENRVRFLTAHRSKGLEAKVVFLLNVTKDTFGFPCQIEDPAIYEPARENYPPQNPLEEERRLFYVAITRAMQDLYIYTKESAMSEFLSEIADYTTEESLKTIKQETSLPIAQAQTQNNDKTKKNTREHESLNTIEEKQEKHPRAYEYWTTEEEQALEKRFNTGNSIAQLAKLHERKFGAIRSRLRKMGLLKRRAY